MDTSFHTGPQAPLYHHTRISPGARVGLAWWARFLPSCNGWARFLDQHRHAQPLHRCFGHTQFWDRVQPVASTCPGEAMKTQLPVLGLKQRQLLPSWWQTIPKNWPLCSVSWMGPPHDGQDLRGNTSLVLGQHVSTPNAILHTQFSK